MPTPKEQQELFEKTGKTPLDTFLEENKEFKEVHNTSPTSGEVYKQIPVVARVPLPSIPFSKKEQQTIEAGSVKAKPVVWPELKDESPAQKFDTGKLPYHLITPEFLEALCVILDFGQKKYAPRNWEKGMNWGRPFSALMRHMWAWWRQEGPDEETGKSHLWHAACCIMFLVTYEMRGTGEDDRPSLK